MNLIIRADASQQIGYGHVMRCLALAQAWQDRGGEVLFLAHELPPALRQRLTTEKMSYLVGGNQPGDEEDAAFVIEQTRAQSAIVVVDGYPFGADYQQRIKAAGLPLLVLDDYAHADFYAADWVLNQNSGAEEWLYPRYAESTRFLLGTRYALIRREFWRGRRDQPAPVGRKILVTLGGTDPQNITRIVIDKLEQIDAPDLDVVIVVSAANPQIGDLQAAVSRSRHAMRLETNVSDMTPLMAWADLALSAAGGTLWELALLGVPTCALITAENQRGGAEAFAASGALRLLDIDFDPDVIGRLLTDEDTRTRLAARAQAAVDGYGVERVIMRVRGEKLWLRPAQADDARLIWEWANEPVVRAASFNSAPIPWEDHVRWFTGKLSDPHALILIGMDADDLPIGQVRFDVEGAEAIISVMVTTARAGKGFGADLIERGVQRVLREHPSVERVLAYIKTENSASIRAFEKAGFAFKQDATVKDNPARLYTRKR
ncbi:MAG: UDP-2,4-diacetamido-2,4,6-trideoxy-beta-L-altropyranose hydrolase [Anaerolinea sp.]|nr:UDP-2,4-diacetamido-2,4,6-trideoxy-beta-L-altropyranose hydrolase [Anaerolinea sp.]